VRVPLPFFSLFLKRFSGPGLALHASIRAWRVSLVLEFWRSQRFPVQVRLEKMDSKPPLFVGVGVYHN
jgi:hypothetical protein